MALPCDLTKAFNDATFSDVTITFSGREIKCHKLVLCLASEYFRALCNPERPFAESTMPVIELHEDDPDALSTLLRHLYNFPYPRSALNGPKFHMDVFITAKKYLVEELPPVALEGLRNSISHIEANYRTSQDINLVFELYQTLSEHKIDHEDIEEMIGELTKKYLGPLFGIAEFRELIEKEDNKTVLDQVVKMVQDAHGGSPGANGGEGAREFATCRYCGALWATAGRLGYYCPDCDNAVVTSDLSRWAPV